MSLVTLVLSYCTPTLAVFNHMQCSCLSLDFSGAVTDGGGHRGGCWLVPHNNTQLRAGDVQHSQLCLLAQCGVEHHAQAARVAIL